MSDHRQLPNWARIVMAVALAVFGLVMAWAVIQPAAPSTLGETVWQRTHELGVQNPVTAVLLGFRGYDTWLEVAVLWLAWLGLRQIIDDTPTADAPPAAEMIMGAYIRAVLPLMIVVAGYLVWAGADRAGGAFQAAAVLAAAGVLLAQSRPGALMAVGPVQERIIGSIGLACYSAVALWSLPETGDFLAYPDGSATVRMLLIEVTAAVALGWILLMLVVGGRTSPPETS